MQRLLGFAAAASLTLAVIVAPPTAYAATPASAGGAGADPGSAAAQVALDRVRGLFSPRAEQSGHDGQSLATARRAGSDPTLALRDLAQLRDKLPAAEQTEAARLLARPTDGGSDPIGNGYDTAQATPVCSAVVCVHYIAKAGDKDMVNPTDANHNGVPDFVDTALATFTHVDSTYVAAGYRAPEGDGTRGGNSLPDIYLANIGPEGFYGYCTSDQLGAPQTTWAYCVVDNDFSRNEFPRHTPVQNLEVTAAHEYFHAVQFGYNYLADSWFMEATATWAEDQVYGDVNDNRQYLAHSPISSPRLPMDQFEKGGTYHYGVWIFFRYLTERFPTAIAGMPTLVRDMWRLDDTVGRAPGFYSMKAIATELGRHHLSIPAAFSHFVVANLMPARFYSEGAAYPKAPLAKRYRLSPGAKQKYAVSLSHLSSATVRYVPTGKARNRARLHLGLDLARKSKGSAALVTIQLKGRAPRVITVPLNARGDAGRGVVFSHAKVAWVEVSLVNAGIAYRCHQHTRFSCGGKPLDDRLVEHLSARVTS